MAVQYRHEFTVVGSGFPLDMLRYDRCSPATEQDSAALGDALGIYGECPEVRKVRLVHIGERQWAPTFRRWASFGIAVAHTFGGLTTDGNVDPMKQVPEGITLDRDDAMTSRKV